MPAIYGTVYCNPVRCKWYTSSPRQENHFFWPAFVARILTPRSRKSGYGLLLGCRSQLDGEPLLKKQNCFRCLKKELAKNRRGKVFTVCFDSLSQLIRRGRISREGALCVRESRERRDKIVPKLSPEKQEKRTQFWPEISHFFEQDRLCSRESTSARQNFRQKQPKKK